MNWLRSGPWYLAGPPGDQRSRAVRAGRWNRCRAFNGRGRRYVQLACDLASATQGVEVHLKDDLGPVNSWSTEDANAWGATSRLLYELDRVHATGCGLGDCRVLDGLDIDRVEVGSSGSGTNNDAGGDFPVGALAWRVTGRL